MAVGSVVVLNDFCHAQGGASRVAIDEAVALRARGLDVTFLGAVAPIGPELPGAGIRTICLQQAQLLDAGHRPSAAAQALWNRQAYRTMRTLLASLDPTSTVVHLHGYTKALSPTPALAASRAGFPIVCTLHDFFAACPNGAFFDYRRQQPCPLTPLSVACMAANCDKRHPAHKMYRVIRGLAQRHIQRFPASVRDYITLSEQSSRVLRRYLPRDARVHALSNVIDVRPDPPVEVDANRDLVVVGRLDVEKGVLLAAKAAERAGLSIVFVGDGPLRREIEARGARVTGWLTADGVRRELDRARCLVFPSLWYETYGLVVDEAAARGVPAIVSDISAPAERIAHGETGWVFPSGNLGALERCMQLTRDLDALNAAGAAAYRKYWANPKTPPRHVQELVAIYDATIAACGSS